MEDREPDTQGKRRANNQQRNAPVNARFLECLDAGKLQAAACHHQHDAQHDQPAVACGCQISECDEAREAVTQAGQRPQPHPANTAGMRSRQCQKPGKQQGQHGDHQHHCAKIKIHFFILCFYMRDIMRQFTRSHATVTPHAYRRKRTVSQDDDSITPPVQERLEPAQDEFVRK